MKLSDARFANGLDGNETSLFLPILLNKKKYWFLFDSGNLRSLLVSQKLPGLINDKDLSAPKIRFNYQSINEPIEPADIIYDGALNFNFIAAYSWLIDLKNNVVYYHKN
jgi:hypothetical protein